MTIVRHGNAPPAKRSPSAASSGSGHVTDVLTLVSPHGTHFVAGNDGHGGTKVTLDPPPVAASVASLSPHHFAEQRWATDTAGSTGHLSDFLFTA
jgi:hypothetical protein